jgi:hypothetical protein
MVSQGVLRGIGWAGKVPPVERPPAIKLHPGDQLPENWQPDDPFDEGVFSFDGYALTRCFPQPAVNVTCSLAAVRVKYVLKQM